MVDPLENSRIQLIKNEPFFGKILCICSIREDKTCPTASAGISKDGKFTIKYNRTWMESLTSKEQTGIWKHEVLHLLFNHTLRDVKNKQRMNMAMDMAINSYIADDYLPEKGCYAQTMNFPKYLTSIQYYNLLGGDSEPLSSMEQGYEFDDHSELSPQDFEKISETLQKALTGNVAREACKGLQVGDQPLELLKLLDIDIFSDGTLSWKTLLRKYAKDTLTNTKIYTRNKPNRRMGFSADGSTDDRLPNIYIAIDESGSIDDELLLEFTGEINRLFKEYSGNIKVLHFDTEISKVEIFKKSVQRVHRYGGGGTNINPVFEMFDAEKGDLLIAFTDGFFFEPSVCKRGKNVLFLIYNNSTFVPEFGKHIIVK